MNIKENLLRMKDMTELMLDLAYSAVFLKDKAITEEVKQMHKEITFFEEETLKMLFRVKEPEEDRMFIVDLTDSMKNIANAALYIASLSERKTPFIVNEIMKESKKRVITARISLASPYANKTVGESQIRENTMVTIIGIKRKNKWIFKIDRNVVLMPNDEVIAMGSYAADKIFKKYASGEA